MRSMTTLIVGLIAGLVVSGCRAATRVTEVPRVDLTLEGGNRGYLVGAPMEAPEMKQTREMVEATVEIPSFYKPKHTGAPAHLEGMAPPETETEEPRGQAPPATRYDTYVVQKGESLWSIAAKPEIYGSATKWRRIYDANRDLLKSPDRVRAGMKLKIPRGEAKPNSNTTYGDEGVTYKK